MATKKHEKASSAPVDDAATTQEPSAAPGLVKVRVLVACSHGQPNDVVQLDPESLAGAVSSGQVDPHPDAVAYALSLKT